MRAAVGGPLDEKFQPMLGQHELIFNSVEILGHYRVDMTEAELNLTFAQFSSATRLLLKLQDGLKLSCKRSKFSTGGMLLLSIACEQRSFDLFPQSIKF